MEPNHKITSLRELPEEIAPPRDLWPQIHAQLTAPESTTRKRPPRAYVWGLAATVAALAVGIWLGRSLVPGSNTVTTAATPTQAELVRAAYATDSRYVQDRAALVKSLESRLEALPPDSRAKVIASLDTIRKSMRDIEQALGRDPSNALLQELLLNTHQDEMRVLTAVQQASESGEEI